MSKTNKNLTVNALTTDIFKQQIERPAPPIVKEIESQPTPPIVEENESQTSQVPIYRPGMGAGPEDRPGNQFQVRPPVLTIRNTNHSISNNEETHVTNNEETSVTVIDPSEKINIANHHQEIDITDHDKLVEDNIDGIYKNGIAVRLLTTATTASLVTSLGLNKLNNARFFLVKEKKEEEEVNDSIQK